MKTQESRNLELEIYRCFKYFIFTILDTMFHHATILLLILSPFSNACLIFCGLNCEAFLHTENTLLVFTAWLFLFRQNLPIIWKTNDSTRQLIFKVNVQCHVFETFFSFSYQEIKPIIIAKMYFEITNKNYYCDFKNTIYFFKLNSWTKNLNLS